MRYKLGMIDGVKGTGVFKRFRLGSFAEDTAEDTSTPAASQPSTKVDVDELITGADVVVFISSKRQSQIIE